MATPAAKTLMPNVVSLPTLVIFHDLWPPRVLWATEALLIRYSSPLYDNEPLSLLFSA